MIVYINISTLKYTEIKKKKGEFDSADHLKQRIL